MMTRSFTAGLMLIAAMLVAADGSAAVLRVAVDEASQRIQVFDGATASTAFVDASATSVQVGSVTADPSGNRVFFIGNRAGEQSIFQINYTTSQQALPQPWDPAFRITHMEWDASGSARLVGVAIRLSDDSATFVKVESNSGIDLGMPEPGCCTFRAGVSAFRSTDDSFFLVGRRATDTQDHLFRFTMNPLALAQVVPIPDDVTVTELDLFGGASLIGLGYSAAAAATKVFTTDAALTITLLGSGASNCCFVMAGSAARDTSTNQLVTLGPQNAEIQPNSPRQWGFSLSSGAIFEGMTDTNGVGLFFDTTPIFSVPVLFADGFE